jgi:hypothetical protein
VISIHAIWEKIFKKGRKKSESCKGVRYRLLDSQSLDNILYIGKISADVMWGKMKRGREKRGKYDKKNK